MGRCFGITRNLNRCGRTGDWKLFCTEHRRQPIIWVFVLLFTVIAGIASIYSVLRPSKEPTNINVSVSSIINKKIITKAKVEKTESHPEPILTYVLDVHPEQKGFLLFTLKNEGLVEAKSVRVKHFTMQYLLKEKKIKYFMGGSGYVYEYNEPGQNWIFVPILKPNMIVSKLTGEFVSPEKDIIVNILYFRICYLVSDTIYKEKDIIYFVEGTKYYTYDEYKKHDDFKVIDQEIKRALTGFAPNWHTLGSHKKQ